VRSLPLRYRRRRLHVHRNSMVRNSRPKTLLFVSLAFVLIQLARPSLATGSIPLSVWINDLPSGAIQLERSMLAHWIGCMESVQSAGSHWQCGFAGRLVLWRRPRLYFPLGSHSCEAEASLLYPVLRLEIFPHNAALSLEGVESWEVCGQLEDDGNGRAVLGFHLATHRRPLLLQHI